MPSDRQLSFLGLLQKGKKLAIGPEAQKARRIALLIVAEDASERSKKEAGALAERKGAELIYSHTKGEIGAAIGKGPTAYLALLGEKEALAYKAKGANGEEET